MTVRRFATSSILALAAMACLGSASDDSDHMVRPNPEPPEPPEPEKATPAAARSAPIHLEFDAELAPVEWAVERPEGDAGIVHDMLVRDDRARALGNADTFIAVRDAITKRVRKGSRATGNPFSQVAASHIDKELAPRWESFCKRNASYRVPLSIGGPANLGDPRLFDADTMHRMIDRLRADLAKQGIRLKTPDDEMRAKLEEFYETSR